MKRDIKLNTGQLKGLSRKLADYIEAVRAIGQAAGTFQDTIREQDSDAYRKLDGLWETNVKENAEELVNRLGTIHYYLSGYITEMTGYITPDDENAMMRADRNDIWFNYQQISFAATSYMDDILPDTGSSWRDYQRNYYYDRRLSPEENDARRAAVEAEVEAERLRRERNYEKLAGFRSMLGGSATEQLQGYVKELKQIYDENVVPFENTDDQYDASLGIRYNEWCSAGDHFRDIGNAIGDFFNGAWNAVKDFAMGIAGLAGGIVKLLGYAGYSLLEQAGLAAVPDDLDADIHSMKDTFVRVIKDPGNVLESVGQGMFDAADEKGIAYSAGYVTMDVVIAILTDKGLDKLKSTGKAGKTTANVADDVTDAVEDAARAGKEVRETAQNAGTVAEGLEGKAAKAAEGAGKGGSNTIPNVESATINPKKLTEYALNPNHPVGGNKARVFESALGYNQSNADDLMRQIYEKLSSSEAVLGKLDEYGQRYTVDIPITGPNGNTVNVRTGWIIRTGSDIPELTTIFVKE